MEKNDVATPPSLAHPHRNITKKNEVSPLSASNGMEWIGVVRRQRRRATHNTYENENREKKKRR